MYYSNFKCWLTFLRTLKNIRVSFSCLFFSYHVTKNCNTTLSVCWSTAGPGNQSTLMELRLKNEEVIFVFYRTTKKNTTEASISPDHPAIQLDQLFNFFTTGVMHTYSSFTLDFVIAEPGTYFCVSTRFASVAAKITFTFEAAYHPGMIHLSSPILFSPHTLEYAQT